MSRTSFKTFAPIHLHGRELHICNGPGHMSNAIIKWMYGCKPKIRCCLIASGVTHILKPIPAEWLERVEEIPANEHVTMQIANQIFGIKTAACGMNSNATHHMQILQS